MNELTFTRSVLNEVENVCIKRCCFERDILMDLLNEQVHLE